MRKETRYVCEVCGTEYSDRTKAERCEAGHHEVDGITELHYQPIAAEPTGYLISSLIVRLLPLLDFTQV